MDSLRLLILPGSARAGALSGQLAAYAARAAEHQGSIRARVFDLRALALPVYDGDLEAAHGVPDGVLELQAALRDSDGVLLVTPEYNGFPTPLVINAFDWLSRIPASDQHPAGLTATVNKPVALLSTSPGPLGGLRAMNTLRQYLQMAFAMLVVPQQYALGRAHEAFDAQGELRDARAVQSVQGVLDSLSALARSLRQG
ncbi:MAG: NADPH-dependent FMN reductase [Thiomonas sp. 20-64-5]|nr:MAG: NADPH-dependent FMN reductase [Thiomonas sp. 20-64-5]